MTEYVQIEAAKIVTGAIKDTKHDLFYNEVCSEALDSRCDNKHMVKLHFI